MISKEEVQHIAKLSRLELTEKETEKMQKDLSAILDYFNLLKKAPHSAKATWGTPTGNILREDKVREGVNVAERLVSQAPDKKDGYIKVKTVL